MDYDVIFNYKYKGEEKLDFNKEVIKSNKINVEVKPKKIKKPKSIKLKIYSKKNNTKEKEIYYEKYITEIEDEKIYKGDNIEINENSKLTDISMNDTSIDEIIKLNRITRLPIEYEVMEDNNLIEIEVLELSVDEKLTNYKVRHLYKDEETNEWKDIIDIAIGEDKVGNLIKVSKKILKISSI